jgi:hypothetical protein
MRVVAAERRVRSWFCVVSECDRYDEMLAESEVER